MAEKRREAKDKRKQERYTHLNAEFQRRATIEKKVFLSDHSKHPLPTTQEKTLHMDIN